MILKKNRRMCRQRGFYGRERLQQVVAGLVGVVLLLPFGAVAATDGEISRTIESNLADYPGISSHLIDVTAEEGVVMLSGTVDHLLAEEQSMALAKSIKGVKSVVDRLEVRPVDVADAQLKENIDLAMASDPATESWEVDVTVNEGVVQLEGEVQSWQERMLAEQVAKRVRGVRAVENRVMYLPPADRSDAEIATDVLQRLKMDARIDSRMMAVDVDDGSVTLSGFVGSSAEQTLASQLAWVQGVQEVDAGGLDVSYTRVHNEAKLRTEPVSYSDAEVRKAIAAALELDPRVSGSSVNVEADYGVVTLSGVVTSFAGRLSAETNARNTVGVKYVENNLKVRPEQWAEDKQLQLDVAVALKRSPYLDRGGIDAQVVNGKVYLRGTVDSAVERHRAYLAASRVDGVVDVENRLVTVSGGESDGLFDHEWYSFIPDAVFSIPEMPMTADEEIRNAVQDELYWSPFIDSDSITVEVEDGSVVLTGFVDDYVERRIATENAWEGGAQGVRNHLTVR